MSTLTFLRLLLPAPFDMPLVALSILATLCMKTQRLQLRLRLRLRLGLRLRLRSRSSTAAVESVRSLGPFSADPLSPIVIHTGQPHVPAIAT